MTISRSVFLSFSLEEFYSLYVYGLSQLYGHNLPFNYVCRKIGMYWIQSASISDQIMACLRINSFLHASISYTKWILKSLILGNIWMVLNLCLQEQLKLGVSIAFFCPSQVQYSKTRTQQCPVAAQIPSCW